MAAVVSPPSANLKWRWILPFVGVVAASVIGGLANAQAIPTWYATLEKPAWNPPNSWFGPVWTVLYVLMAVAAGLVGATDSPHRRAALTAWWVQLGLNALWSVLFFGMRMILPAFFEIAALAVAILVTIGLFFRVRPLAGWLLVPYLAWVLYAGTLNGAIYLLNR